MVIGEYELIRSSKYKFLVDTLNGLYTISKLSNEQRESMLIKFHDQVNGTFGWNVFMGNVKFNLGVMDYSKNQMILDFKDYDGDCEIVQEILEQNNMRFSLIQKENIFTIVHDLNYEVNEENIEPIIKLIEFNFKNNL